MTVITLLTDFGTTDAYVAELKGALLSAAPSATLVDVTHGIAPGDVRSAAYVSAARGGSSRRARSISR